MNNNQHEGFEV